MIIKWHMEQEHTDYLDSNDGKQVEEEILECFKCNIKSKALSSWLSCHNEEIHQNDQTEEILNDKFSERITTNDNYN